MHRSRLLRAIATLVLVAGIFAATPGAGRAQGSDGAPRFALLVANEKYGKEGFKDLDNPKHDIDLVASALLKIGFLEKNVSKVTDATAEVLRGKLQEYIERLKLAGDSADPSGEKPIGVFYYSGHGAAAPPNTPGAAAGNYIIPIGAGAPERADFWQRAIGLNEIRKTLEEARNTTQLVIFDACRDELKLPTRGYVRGFEQVLLPREMEMLFAFATAPNEKAYDSWQQSHNSPYALAFAQELEKPGLDHLQLFSRVRADVRTMTLGRQVPWIQDGLNSPLVLYLAPSATQHEKCVAAITPVTQVPVDWSEVPDKSSLRFKNHTYTFESDLTSARRIEEVDEGTTHFIVRGTKISRGTMNGAIAWYRYQRNAGPTRLRYVVADEVELR